LLSASPARERVQIKDNDFNLNISRYIDTFEPEPRIEVNDALKALVQASSKLEEAESHLMRVLSEVGYDA
jgi:type I restriction enzyme M protein